MFKELDTVVLKSAPADTSIQVGAVGVIVHVHSVPRTAYLVEFCNDKGETLDTLSLLPSQIEPVQTMQQAA